MAALALNVYLLVPVAVLTLATTSVVAPTITTVAASATTVTTSAIPMVVTTSASTTARPVSSGCVAIPACWSAWSVAIVLGFLLLDLSTIPRVALDLLNFLAHSSLNLFVVGLESQVLLALSNSGVTCELGFALGLLHRALQLKSVSELDEYLVCRLNVIKLGGWGHL